MLSNTAVPYYYGKFRNAVQNGRIPICEEVALEMERIDELIANPKYYYDEYAVEGWIQFCENELVLTDGSPFHMLDTFKLWGEQIFGWYEFVERTVYDPDIGDYVYKTLKERLVKKQYLIIPRGAAKTMYDYCVHSYYLVVDPATTNQVTTAPTMKQAEEVLSPFRTAISRAPGPVFQMLTQGSINNTTGSKVNRPHLASTKKGIENFLTNSILEIRPMSIDKLQGLRIKVATVDEWLSGTIRENPIEALEQGARKGSGYDDFVILATSSEGTVRNGVGDDIKMELMKILRGEITAPDTSIWYYKLDNVDEVGMPEMWIKANPNIGKTVTYDTYHLAVERAEQVPSLRNEILAKRFNIPLEGYTYFFTYAETLPVDRRLNYWGMSCSLGADLSQGDDFCAFTFLFPLSDGSFGVKTRSYISELTFAKLNPSMRFKYEEFRKEGSLIVMEGTILDMISVYEDLDQHIQNKEYTVMCLGYDPYNARDFVTRWESENGPFGIEKVIQGSKTESVPLGELKKLAGERLLLFDEELMKYTLGNCIVIEDTNGNRKLLKRRHEEKIDNVAALMDAFVAYKLNKEAFE